MSSWPEDVSNLPVSIKARLKNLADANGGNMEVVLSRYGTERLMYRISQSEYQERFVLKGAWLFYLWGMERRSTKDVDLLGFLDAEMDAVEEVFRNLAELEPPVDDGLVFDPETLRLETNQKDGDYQGVRVKMIAFLGDTRIHTQVDLGFGEALHEAPERVELPVLLELPPPYMRVYPAAAAIAEKLEAIVKFGRATTRFKDFFDLYILREEKPFDGAKLQAQIEATFRRRGTEIPASVPGGLSEEFGADIESQRTWEAFLDRSDAKGAPDSFSEVLAALRAFLLPVLHASEAGKEWTARWEPSKGWS